MQRSTYMPGVSMGEGWSCNSHLFQKLDKHILFFCLLQIPQAFPHSHPPSDFQTTAQVVTVA